jgi:hypothetical protein
MMTQGALSAPALVCAVPISLASAPLFTDGRYVSGSGQNEADTVPLKVGYT